MTKFLIVRSIFAPDKTYLETTMKSIKETLNFVMNTNYNKIIFIGYSKFEIHDEIKQLCELHKLINYQIITWKVNFGKYRIINKIFNEKNYNVILYFDHDIKINFDNSIYQILAKLYNSYIEQKKIGYVALNQSIDIRHQIDIYENNLSIDNINICYPNQHNFGSISNGCFAIFDYCFKEISLKEISVYGFDDYYLNKEIVEKNYMCVVLKDFYVIHEFEKNMEYNNWKNKIRKYLIDNKVSYYQSMEDGINFWNNFL